MNEGVKVGKAIWKPGMDAACRNVDLQGEKNIRCQKRHSADWVGGMGYALNAVFR